MIRKLIVFIICFLFISTSCFAENYKLPAAYKTEIDEILSFDIKCLDYQVTLVSFTARKLFESFLVDKNKQTNKNLYIDSFDELQGKIQTNEFNSYMQLIKITDKYKKISDKIPNTGYSGELEYVLTPVLKANNINYEVLNKLSEHTAIESEKINYYKEQVYNN